MSLTSDRPAASRIERTWTPSLSRSPESTRTDCTLAPAPAARSAPRRVSNVSIKREVPDGNAAAEGLLALGNGVHADGEAKGLEETPHLRVHRVRRARDVGEVVYLGRLEPQGGEVARDPVAPGDQQEPPVARQPPKRQLEHR